MKNEKRYETLSFDVLQTYCGTYCDGPVRILPGIGDEEVSAADIMLGDLIQLPVQDGDPMADFLETFEIVIEGGSADTRLA